MPTSVSPPPAVGGGGPPVFAALAMAAAGEAWGDPEPHIVNINPDQGGDGTVVVVVGEGILPGATICLRDKAGNETALTALSTDPLDDYHAANFRRVYIRRAIPSGVTPGLYAIRVRNDDAGAVLGREHFIGFGPSFKVL